MVGKLFIISAPSGAGKTTLANLVLNRLHSTINISKIITYTTKTPRPHEIQGVDYHFISVEEFKEKIAKDFFIEHSTAYGHFYGSPASIIKELKKGKSFILILDRSGALRIKEYMKQAILIWIYPKTIHVLEERLNKRNTENQLQIKKRLELAQQELDDETINKIFDHHLLNDDLELALSELTGFIVSCFKDPHLGSFHYSRKNFLKF